MTNRILYLGREGNAKEYEILFRENFGVQCDIATTIGEGVRKSKEGDYGLIFVHLGIYADGDKPARLIRSFQEDAFIVGVGGELKGHYSQSDLEGCNEFYAKGSEELTRLEGLGNLLGKLGIIKK